MRELFELREALERMAARLDQEFHEMIATGSGTSAAS